MAGEYSSNNVNIVETDNLLTIANYAKLHEWTASYIYKLIKANKLKTVVVDGVQFIDMTSYL